MKNGRLDAVDRSDSFGFGVRAIADGAWGFAASQIVTAQEADRVAALAVEIAKASAITKKRDAALAPVDPVQATYETPMDHDPFTLSFDDRVKLLMDADARMRERKGLRTTRATYALWREEKLFLSSEGADIAQRLTEVGGGIAAEAVGNGELQIRSYPDGLALPERRRVGGAHQLGPHRECRARRRRGGRASLREAVSAGRDHERDPQRESALAAVSRELRSSDRARPRARQRGGVRRHLVPDARQAREIPLRQSPR